MRDRRKRDGIRAAILICMAAILGISLVISVFAVMTTQRTEKQVEELTAQVESLTAQLSGGEVTAQAELPPLETETATPPAETEAAQTTENETETEPEKTGIFPADTYNYLAIGNSITKHSVCDYWWGTWGMAASTQDKDYPHLVNAMLTERFGPVTTEIINLSVWETQSYDRAQTLATLDKYLDENLNLVTIQLGEDCYDMTTFENDYIEMIRYIGSKAPNAHIMVLGDVWDFPPRDELKLAACVKSEIPFVDLAEMKDNPLYQCGLGTVVYGDDGQQHVVEHVGAAKHPGDQGHQFMADKIIAALDYWEE